MDNFEVIKEKLEAFVGKYHMNALIKGVILFFAMGLCYFLITLLVEHFLWLDPLGRTILFWLFVMVELGLFVVLICKPLLRFLKLSKGLDHVQASKIIGNHFPEVKDILLNALQLDSDRSSSELILASIDQKSKKLQSVPFRLAVNLKKNLGYLKYAAIPVLLFLGIHFLGGNNWFNDSYDRVVNYRTAYEPPAPFRFQINNKSLLALEDKSYTLSVSTIGDLVPENASIVFGNEIYFLSSKKQGVFEYTFARPKSDIEFRLQANGVRSIPYTLQVAAVPTLLGFDMLLDYPTHTGKADEIISSSGSATVPEGTKVRWKLRTRNTMEVTMKYKDTSFIFTKKKDLFELQKSLYTLWDYELSTSNSTLKEYENLSFTIDIIKDQYPELVLQSQRDSLDRELYYFLGRVSDDYGIRKLQLVYYEGTNPQDTKIKSLPLKNHNFDEFSYTFPEGLDLNQGVNYEFYFQVFDNDVLHGYKSVKSEVFQHRKYTTDEKEELQLEQQNKSIDGFTESLEKFKAQERVLKELSDTQKEKKSLSFNERKKLKDFVERQQQQELMMKNFTKQLKENLDNLKEEAQEEDEFKEALKERLERQEKKLKENEKLLDELKKLADKLEKEQLSEKLDELQKQNKNTEKNLAQMVELTKRYYVIKKHEQLATALENLAKAQEALSDKKEEENTEQAQQQLSEEFKKFQEEMEQLREDNAGLKQPMNLDQNKADEQEIEVEQQGAEKNLKKGAQEQARKQQKNAANKMKNMSRGMQMEMQSMGADAQEEDREMLRQALDNLVDFSLAQESLMDRFKAMSENNPDYARSIRRQSVLREHFKHIDDTLYALALRTPKITEAVTEKLTEIEFSMDQALALLSENQLRQGSVKQQYSVTNANDLAYMLSKSLDQMNASMQSSGSSKNKKGAGFQLPDIIKKQEELNEEMRKGLEQGKEKGAKEGESQEGTKPGQETGQQPGDQPGDQPGGQSGGKPGSQGEQGSGVGSSGDTQGESGDQGVEGKNGKGRGKQQGTNQNGGGKSPGDSGDPREGDSGYRESLNGALYEVFKQQQQLREALRDKLVKEGVKGNTKTLIKQMEQVERELLGKGFNEGTLRKMENVQHQLLQLDKASFQQGKEERRESTTNQKDFQNGAGRIFPEAKQYFRSTEILNRQVLPLRNVYKNRVQQYFKKNND